MTDTIQITLPRDVAERYAEYANAVYETRSAVMDREDDRHSWRDLEDVGTIAHALTSSLEAALEAVEFGLEPTTVNPSLEDALHESRLFLSDELDDKSEAQ